MDNIKAVHVLYDEAVEEAIDLFAQIVRGSTDEVFAGDYNYVVEDAVEGNVLVDFSGSRVVFYYPMTYEYEIPEEVVSGKLTVDEFVTRANEESRLEKIKRTRQRVADYKKRIEELQEGIDMMEIELLSSLSYP
ncbi:MAG: hypothetical protein WC965_02195 [Thiohalomonadaceae bacterium]